MVEQPSHYSKKDALQAKKKVAKRMPSLKIFWLIYLEMMKNWGERRGGRREEMEGVGQGIRGLGEGIKGSRLRHHISKIITIFLRERNRKLTS